MALKILSAPPPDPEQVAVALRSAIEAELPGATVEVKAASPGHFEISVVSEAFEGKPRVAQQQMVYKAIGGFLTGDEAPVHAIDRMETVTP
jgi:acid stress-induced BolA-like protein IbaG/YrbA